MAKDESTLKVGWAAAITLKPDTAPLRCYVGEIQAVDKTAIRLTLVDWVTGMFTSYDLWIPWSNVESMYVCTEEHDRKGFGDYAGKWQTKMNGTDDVTEKKP